MQRLRQDIIRQWPSWNIVCPLTVSNRVEAELAWGSAIKSPADGLLAGQWLCDRYGFTAAMVKLDADGIALVGPGVQQHVPTRPRQVCDVTGAPATWCWPFLVFARLPDGD